MCATLHDREYTRLKKKIHLKFLILSWIFLKLISSWIFKYLMFLASITLTRNAVHRLHGAQRRCRHISFNSSRNQEINFTPSKVEVESKKITSYCLSAWTATWRINVLLYWNTRSLKVTYRGFLIKINYNLFKSLTSTMQFWVTFQGMDNSKTKFLQETGGKLWVFFAKKTKE